MKRRVEQYGNIEKYIFRMEAGDEGYAGCTWADILIDYDAYAIYAQTDCGDYVHRWPMDKHESFRDFCLDMLADEEYLLEKFSKKTEFSLSESKLLFVDFYPQPKHRATVDVVNGIEALTEAGWIKSLHEIGVDDPEEYVVREYPAQAFTFIRLLKNILLPEMYKRRSDVLIGLNAYQTLAQRTSSTSSDSDKIENGCLGLAGESGEVCDILKKYLFQGHELDREAILDELGDVLWYVVEVATGLGVTLEDVATHNIAKLKARYPDGFSTDRSVHRPEYEAERRL